MAFTIQSVRAPQTVAVPATTGSTVIVPRSQRSYLSITNLSDTEYLFLGLEHDGVLDSGEVIGPRAKQIYEGTLYNFEIRGYATGALNVAYQVI